MSEAEKKYFRKILSKYNNGEANIDEKRFLERFYNLFEVEDDPITEVNEAEYEHLKESIKNAIDEKIVDDKNEVTIKFKPFWFNAAAAVIVLFLMTYGSYKLLKTDKVTRIEVSKNNDQSIIPGGNKAVLTLADGTQLILDEASKGEVARQAGVVITKAADGRIIYKTVRSNSTVQQLLQNTIATPKGGQYQVILPDGSSVWLNSASSITYPTSFSGKERLVLLKGEAYFEVAKNKKMPFKVRSGQQTVEVLGTHFNVNAYDDEPHMETTLLEGSVKLMSPVNSTFIVPGEQGVVSETGTIIKHMVDVDKEVAWKNGLFSFEGQDIHAIMRQISRWYNIDVIYDKNLPQEKYYGEIERSSRLENVFKILELNSVVFTLQGKTVLVSYKKQK
jgi:transmembrane sensor